MKRITFCYLWSVEYEEIMNFDNFVIISQLFEKVL